MQVDVHQRLLTDSDQRVGHRSKEHGIRPVHDKTVPGLGTQRRLGDLLEHGVRGAVRRALDEQVELPAKRLHAPLGGCGYRVEPGLRIRPPPTAARARSAAKPISSRPRTAVSCRSYASRSCS